MSFYKVHSAGIDIQVIVQPRSAMNKIVGLVEDRLKLKLKAPPVDGAANKMCMHFLSKMLHVPKTNIEILSGQTSRKKNIRITGNPDDILQFLKKIQKDIQ